MQTDDYINMWRGHRIILPEVRERDIKLCADCRFFIKIQGKEEFRGAFRESRSTESYTREFPREYT